MTAKERMYEKLSEITGLKNLKQYVRVADRARCMFD
jgi:hypothetical protein